MMLENMDGQENDLVPFMFLGDIVWNLVISNFNEWDYISKNNSMT